MPACEPGENGELCRAIKQAEFKMKLRQGQINQAAFNAEVMKLRRSRKNRRNTRRNRKNRKSTRRNRRN